MMRLIIRHGSAIRTHVHLWLAIFVITFRDSGTWPYTDDNSYTRLVREHNTLPSGFFK